MTSRLLAVLLLLAAFAGVAPAQEKAASPKDHAKGKAEEPARAKTARATFGGGCFWCLEAVYERIPGVKTVVSGYAGGSVVNPTYDQVSTGRTGHAEVVQIEFDPEKIAYERLLEVFWACHDPTTPNQQGVDIGPQYRSIILYHDEAQRSSARESIEAMGLAGTFPAPIVTELVPLKAFYPADKHHQDFYRRNRNARYCQTFITPKLHKMGLIK